jgi:glycosyltransferase involved in cell wall biosynthesis/GT2 family glycosyltransferase
MISLSIVIPTRNREKDLLTCINSIVVQTVLPTEILVIDDGEISEEVLKKIESRSSFKDIRFKYFKKNKPGLSESKNLGAKKSVGDVVLFLDDDVVLRNDYIENIIGVWNNSWNKKSVAGVSGIIENSRNRSFVETIFNRIFCLYSEKPWTILPWGFQTWDWNINKECVADWLPGGTSSFRREVFDKYLFEPLQPGRTSLEDFEFCWKLKNNGYYFIITPAAKLNHYESKLGREAGYISGLKESANRKIIFNIHAKKITKNYLCFFWSNLGWICRQFLIGHFAKGLGMIRGVFIKDKILYKSDKKIKITFFIENLDGGGAERVTVNLLKNLNKNIYETSLILLEKRGFFLKDVPEYVKIGSIGSKSLLKNLFFLINYFKQQKPDIFISESPILNILSIFAKIISREKHKVIIIEHNVFSLSAENVSKFLKRLVAKFLFPFLIKIFYRYAEAIVCVSNGVADDVIKITGLKNKIEVIYNPIVSQEIYDLSSQHVNHPWFLDKKEPIIIAVGRLFKVKDYPTLISAFSIMRKKRRAKLLILGKGAELDKLKRLVTSLGISSDVDFLGFQENPYKFMSKADVFVLSSMHEGFGNVIVEAMVCGVPVVSTDCKSGPNEIIENGKSGLLVPPRDPDALADAILKILSNQVLSEKLSSNGRLRANNFSILESVSKYENIFNNLL